MDVHKVSTTYAVFHGACVVEGPKRFKNSPEAFRELARTYPGVPFLMEACGLHEWIHDVLVEEGVAARMFVPPKRELGEKKNDAKDTVRLGRRFLAGDLREVKMASVEIRRVREIVRQRVFLAQERTALVNRIKHELNRWGFPQRNPDLERDVFREEGRRVILREFQHLSVIYGLVDRIDDDLKKMNKELERIGGEIPIVKRLRTIPGFGPLVSLAFYVEVFDINRFPTGENLVSYFGLDPKWGQSGDRRWDHHRISHEGRAYIRGLLNQAAWVHTNYAPESSLTRDYENLSAKKSKPQAIVMVQRKLVLTAHKIWKDDRDFTMTRPAPLVKCRISRATT